MKTLYANIEDVMREAAARWTLVTYFFLSTVFILIFASAINLDIVDGALAGAKLFGHEVQTRGDNSFPIEKIVLGFESGFSSVLYFLCVFLAVFATAHLVPRMQEKGTIDLYLARPTSRLKLILSRYVAGLTLAGSNIVYLLGSIWLIVLWKTHVFHPRFLLAGVIVLFVTGILLAFSFLIGTVTSSTAVSIMGTYGLWLFSGLLSVFHDRLAAVVSHEWTAWLIQSAYWASPKVTELGVAAGAFVFGQDLPGSIGKLANPTFFYTTGAFGAVCLVLACWTFQRKEF